MKWNDQIDFPNRLLSVAFVLHIAYDITEAKPNGNFVVWLLNDVRCCWLRWYSHYDFKRQKENVFTCQRQCQVKSHRRQYNFPLRRSFFFFSAVCRFCICSLHCVIRCRVIQSILQTILSHSPYIECICIQFDWKIRCRSFSRFSSIKSSFSHIRCDIFRK